MSPYRVFLTGEPGCGKTTVVRKICEMLTHRGRKPGGMISGEIRDKGVRIGFQLEDILTREIGTLAHVNQPDGPRIGKYRVNISDLERVGAVAIRRAITEADVILVDEIGPMELNSQPFIYAVESAMESPKPFIGTIHRRATHHLVTSIKLNSSYKILEVTQENRQELPSRILGQVIGQV